MRTISRRTRVAAAVAACVLAGTAFAATGPSSSQSPYLVPTLAGVEFTSILTAGDSVNDKPDGTPYRMVGIPDGLGAFENRDGTFTVLMNHELGNTNGIVRAHGAKGAFVSKWIIDKDTLDVIRGEDLIQDVGIFNGTAWDFSTSPAFNRFCSADLPVESAFYNRRTRRGYDGRLFLNGEEAGAEGLSYAHAMDGKSYRLPWLGRMSFENVVANPDTGDTTCVACSDDDGAGQIYIYIGRKTKTGDTPVDKAGLTNGVLYGVKIDGFPAEVAATGIPSGTSFGAFAFGDVFTTTGAALQTRSHDNAVTEFNRPEDCHWDPKSPDDLYFVTTASFTGASRLWRLRFHDAARPWLGGTIDMLLDGTEGPKMMDNITVNGRHQVVIQEDVGGQEHIGKIWRYDVPTDTLTELAQHDPARFSTGGASFLTIDEESSGVIDVSKILGKGTYLLDVQAHYATDTETVQGGQLLVMRVREDEKHGKNDRRDDDDDDRDGPCYEDRHGDR